MPRSFSSSIYILLSLALAGCSFAGQGIRSDLAGVWFGTLGVSCNESCFNTPEISFTLFQQPSGISGFYKCWIGRDECPEPDGGGKVIILSSGAAMLAMQVIMHDGSRCLFQGSHRGDEIAGGRICYTPEGSASSDWWHIQRAY